MFKVFKAILEWAVEFLLRLKAPTVVEYSRSNDLYHVRKSKLGVETAHYISEYGYVWRDADTLERVNIFVEAELSNALSEFQAKAHLEKKLAVKVVRSEAVLTFEE